MKKYTILMLAVLAMIVVAAVPAHALLIGNMDINETRAATPEAAYATVNGGDLVRAIEEIEDRLIVGEGYNPDFERVEYVVAGYNPTSVPEPATMILLGTGLIGLVGLSRQKMKK